VELLKLYSKCVATHPALVVKLTTTSFKPLLVTLLIVGVPHGPADCDGVGVGVGVNVAVGPGVAPFNVAVGAGVDVGPGIPDIEIHCLTRSVLHAPNASTFI
jgi:hypothetical protein